MIVAGSLLNWAYFKNWERSEFWCKIMDQPELDDVLNKLGFPVMKMSTFIKWLDQQFDGFEIGF